MFVRASRAFFGAVGTAYDVLIPPRIVAYPTAASVTAAGPAEVSADQTPAPSVGHLVLCEHDHRTVDPVTGLMVCGHCNAYFYTDHQTSAGPPAAVDDPAGILPPLPAGSPTTVPAELSARSDCDAALPVGHDPSDLLIAAANQLAQYRLIMPESTAWALRSEYVADLIDELRSIAAHLKKSEAAARIVSRLHAAAETFPQHQK